MVRSSQAEAEAATVEEAAESERLLRCRSCRCCERQSPPNILDVVLLFEGGGGGGGGGGGIEFVSVEATSVESESVSMMSATTLPLLKGQASGGLPRRKLSESSDSSSAPDPSPGAIFTHPAGSG
eukprot:g9764.t1